MIPVVQLMVKIKVRDDEKKKKKSYKRVARETLLTIHVT